MPLPKTSAKIVSGVWPAHEETVMIGMKRNAALALLHLARDIELIACQLIVQEGETVKLKKGQYNHLLQSAETLKRAVADITR